MSHGLLTGAFRPGDAGFLNESLGEPLARGECPKTIEGGHNGRMVWILRKMRSVVGLAVALVAGFLALAAQGEDSTDDEDLPDGGFRGGVLNYRTGKLDDGTDPYGWYEDD
jgi:hypothetical protein